MDIEQLRREAESGSVVAQGVLGLCYLYGRGVDIDYDEALRLLSMAKDNGTSRAVVNLARMYAEGLGVRKDMAKAIRFYQAVEKVELRAQLELARIYANGESVKVNPKAALSLYSNIAKCEDAVEDAITAAFVGSLTFDEIEEARNYVATTT